MDITTPTESVELNTYRTKLQEFIQTHAPTSGLSLRAGVRTPRSEAEFADARRWVSALHHSGFQILPWAPDTTTLSEAERHVCRDELERTDMPSLIGNPLVGHALHQFGTVEQQQRFLGPLERAEEIWCQLFSEPEAGSDLASLRTRAVPGDDGYLISGQKVWTTWGEWADFGFLLARTDNSQKHGGITAFVINMRQPGVDVRPLREITGTSDFCEVFFDEAVVPLNQRIGEEGQGWRVATACLAAERETAARMGLHLADEVREHIQTVAAHPAPAGALSEQQQFMSKMAGLYERARILQFLGLKATTRRVQGRERLIDAPLQKLFFSEANLDIAVAALQLFGASIPALVSDDRRASQHRCQDAYLYARAYTIAGGSSEILRTMLAERGLGMPKERHP